MNQLKQKRYYTDMKEIFDGINNVQTDYNWLITNYECNHYPDDKIPFDKDYVWISGEELTDIVKTNSIQFIWGVFSGFNKNVSLYEVLKEELPFADGYTGFWENEITMQHPLAEIEIVPWDSSVCLLISKHSDTIDCFRKHFEDSRDLQEYNSSLKS